MFSAQTSQIDCYKIVSFYFLILMKVLRERERERVQHVRIERNVSDLHLFNMFIHLDTCILGERT